MITQERLKGCGWVKGHLVNIYVEFVLAALDGGNDLLRCILSFCALIETECAYMMHVEDLSYLKH